MIFDRIPSDQAFMGPCVLLGRTRRWLPPNDQVAQPKLSSGKAWNPAWANDMREGQR